MKIKRAEIVHHDSGWKGNWYRTGQIHYVVEKRAPHLACAYAAVDIPGGVKESDCVIKTGAINWLLCLSKQIKVMLNLCKNFA